MSITAARLQAEVGADTKGFDRGMAHADTTVKKAPGRWSKALKIGAGVGLGLAAGVIVKGVSTALRGGLTALREDQVVMAQTTAVIKSTGGAAHVTAAQIEALSGAIERKTATEDVAVQAGANMLLTFTNIRDEAGAGNDIFSQSVSVLTDMSRAMGTDMKSGAIQLGKALNDPLKGITALQRVGVTFDASQKKRIAAFMAEGKVAEAQKIILAELNKEFGKSGAAFSATDVGQAEQYGFAVEDVEKAFSEGLFPAITNVRAALTRFLRDPATLTAATTLGDKIAGIFSVPNLDKAVGVVTGAVGKITGLATSPEGKGFGDMITGAFKGAAKFAAAIPWDSVSNVMRLTGQGAKAALDMFMAMPDWVKTAVITGWGLNKLTGGAVSSIISELGKGLIKGVLGMNTAVANVNAGVVNVGGVGGVAAGAAGAAAGGGGLGGLVKTGLKLILPAAVLAEALNLANENLVLPGLQEQAGTNIANAEVQLKKGSLAELKTALSGLQDIPNHLDLVGKLLYDNNAYGVKAHNEAMQQAYAAEINRQQGQTGLEAILGSSDKTIGGILQGGLDTLNLAGTGQIGLLRASLAVHAGVRAVTSTVAAATSRVATITAGVKAVTGTVAAVTRSGLASTTSASRLAATGSAAAAAAIRAKKFSATVTNRMTIRPAPVTLRLNTRVLASAWQNYQLLAGHGK